MAHPYEHAMPVPASGPLGLATLVPGEGPCDLELGFGRADFLLERARRHPERRLLGLEVRLKWVAIAEEKLAGQLRRHKQRLTDHHRGEESMGSVPPGVGPPAASGGEPREDTYDDVIDRLGEE